jgi:hypothetical protein
LSARGGSTSGTIGASPPKDRGKPTMTLKTISKKYIKKYFSEVLKIHFKIVVIHIFFLIQE